MGERFMGNEWKIEGKWYVMDGEGERLGGLWWEVGCMLGGKNKVSYRADVDTGDYVMMINAWKMELSGKKEEEKMY